MDNLVAIRFLDGPAKTNGRPVSSMVEAPKALRVACHRDSKGVYELLGENETRQDRYWEIVVYRQVRDGVIGADYKLVGPDPVSGVSRGLPQGAKDRAA
jgi:hypothetical protein